MKLEGDLPTAPKYPLRLDDIATVYVDPAEGSRVFVVVTWQLADSPKQQTGMHHPTESAGLRWALEVLEEAGVDWIKQHPPGPDFQDVPGRQLLTWCHRIRDIHLSRLATHCPGCGAELGSAQHTCPPGSQALPFAPADGAGGNPMATTSTPAVQLVPIANLFPAKDNPRADVGDVTELAESISSQGILQPLVVHEVPGGYQVLMGHRRLAGAKAAALKEVPVIVRQGEISDRDRLEVMLVENIQRNDLTAVEEAKAYKRLEGFGATQRDIASRVGRSQSHVAKRLKLANLEPAGVKLLDSGRITIEEAMELAEVSVELQEKVTKEKAKYSYTSIHSLVSNAVRDERRSKNRRESNERIKRDGLSKLMIKPTQLERGKHERLEGAGRPTEYYYKTGVKMTLTEHKKLPCHRWFIDIDGKLGGACADPTTHLPKDQAKKRQEANAEEAKWKAERKALEEARAAIAERRQAFAAGLIKKPPKHTSRFALRGFLVDIAESNYGQPVSVPEVMATLAHPAAGKGHTEDVAILRELVDRSHADLERVMIARHVAAGEAAWKCDQHYGAWGSWWISYLDFLLEAGYETSPLEDEFTEQCGGRASRAAIAEALAVAECRVCGCTEDDACDGGCSWVEDPMDEGPLCSTCLPLVETSPGRAYLPAPDPEADAAALTALAKGEPIHAGLEECPACGSELGAGTMAAYRTAPNHRPGTTCPECPRPSARKAKLADAIADAVPSEVAV